MIKPMVRIYTDADNFIDREMNAEEYEQFLIDKAENDAEVTRLQETSDAKNALLERLGLTAEEARLLLG